MPGTSSIVGFGSGDTIDLLGDLGVMAKCYAGASHSGSLVLTSAHGSVGLQFAGDYTLKNFACLPTSMAAPHHLVRLIAAMTGRGRRRPRPVRCPRQSFRLPMGPIERLPAGDVGCVGIGGQGGACARLAGVRIADHHHERRSARGDVRGGYCSGAYDMAAGRA